MVVTQCAAIARSALAANGDELSQEDISDGSNSPGDLELALDQDQNAYGGQFGPQGSLKRPREDSAADAYRKSAKTAVLKSPEMKFQHDAIKQEYDPNNEGILTSPSFHNANVLFKELFSVKHI